ncbi:MAG: HAD-IA family hydrolase [Bacteroides sp.]|nr:HAD-IA family hydrolase [Bacteroides sp.]
MNPKLIIFDFDGTLADTTATIIATYQATIKEVGAEPRSESECQATIGVPQEEGFRQLYPGYSDDEIAKCVDAYRRIFIINKSKLIPKLYPGVMATLEKLHGMGIEMSVASSRSRWSLLEFCDENNISSFFKLIIGADDVTHAKPNPEPVLKTLETLNVSPADAIVVGDMPVDIAMGSGAGCETVGVTYGNSSRKDLEAAGATAVIDALPELLGLIK